VYQALSPRKARENQMVLNTDRHELIAGFAQSVANIKRIVTSIEL
jgi:hypothetical protein